VVSGGMAGRVETGAAVMVELVKYNAMCRAIVAAHRIDEVKHIRNVAMAVQCYARQAKNLEAEQQAIEIRIRAERRAGELLSKMPKNNGVVDRDKKGQTRSSGGRPRVSEPPTLADLGITKSQSSRWQKLATMKDEEFEQGVATGQIKPTVSRRLECEADPRIDQRSYILNVLVEAGRLADDVAGKVNDVFDFAPLADAARRVAQKWSKVAAQLEGLNNE
jgi:hypothetical protein